MHNAHLFDRQARHSAEPLPHAGRQVLSERAGAKINLSLHVLGRRADGYHSLESLVVFSGVGDHLRLEPDQAPGVETHGPYAQAAGPAEENLVLKAEAALGKLVPNMRSGRFTLVKRIPVAAGLGGGSADAAAALRLLAKLNGLDSDDARLAEAAAETGSDVTVCLRPRAAMLHDRGERVDRQVEVPPLAAVLVNPRTPLSTPRVFAALKLAPGERRDGAAHCALPAGAGRGALIELLCGCRNDLEDAAAGLEPAVAEALDLLRAAPQTRLARMSGSGATVFALTADPRGACQLAQAIRRARPHWWVRPTVLR
jgi:4-diphosphocytidyl-2-C-methyl-D-erythritol kinase